MRFEERFHRPTAIHRLHPHDAAATKDAVRAARDAGPTAAVPRHTPPTPSGMARRPPTFLQPRTPATSPQQNPKVKRIPWACGSGMRPFRDTPLALFAFSGRGVRKGMRLRFCAMRVGGQSAAAVAGPLLLALLPQRLEFCCRRCLGRRRLSGRCPGPATLQPPSPSAPPLLSMLPAIQHSHRPLHEDAFPGRAGVAIHIICLADINDSLSDR